MTENYKTQLEEYEKELLRAKQERDDLSNLSNANEIFSVRLEETERKLLESEAENETLTQNYNTIVAQLEEAKKELTEVRQKGDEISDVNVTLTDRFEKNEIKLLENESKLQENERLVRNYEAQLEEERNELTQVKQEIETVLEANRKLSTQLEQVELTHQKETDFLKAAIEKFERDKSDCETITLQLEETEKKLQTLESDHREEINKLKADYESLCQISSGREADLDKHKRCVEEANQQIENFREKNEKLAAEINGYDIQVEDLKKDAQELSAENRQLKQALEVQQTETEQRIEDLKKAQLEKGSDDFELQVLVDENKRLCENELLGKKHVKEFELR